MDPSSSDYQPGNDLPKLGVQTGSGGQKDQAAPTPIAQNGVSSPIPQTLPASPLQPLDISASPPVNQLSPQSIPVQASDSDLIEQEWVHKAKAIVEQTKNDPHRQNEEINKFKAEYIKKRYNREIKVDET